MRFFEKSLKEIGILYSIKLKAKTSLLVTHYHYDENIDNAYTVRVNVGLETHSPEEILDQLDKKYIERELDFFFKQDKNKQGE